MREEEQEEGSKNWREICGEGRWSERTIDEGKARGMKEGIRKGSGLPTGGRNEGKPMWGEGEGMSGAERVKMRKTISSEGRS